MDTIGNTRTCDGTRAAKAADIMMSVLAALLLLGAFTAQAFALRAFQRSHGLTSLWVYSRPVSLSTTKEITP